MPAPSPTGVLNHTEYVPGVIIRLAPSDKIVDDARMQINQIRDEWLSKRADVLSAVVSGSAMLTPYKLAEYAAELN
jgi:hypothetical protein